MTPYISFLTLPHLQVQDGRGRAEDCLQHAAPDPGDAQPHQRQAHQRHGQPRQVRGKLPQSFKMTSDQVNYACSIPECPPESSRQ